MEIHTPKNQPGFFVFQIFIPSIEKKSKTLTIFRLPLFTKLNIFVVIQTKEKRLCILCL